MEQEQDYFIMVDFTNQLELDKFIKLTEATEEQLTAYKENDVKLLMFSLNNGIVNWYMNTKGELFSHDGNITTITELDLDMIERVAEDTPSEETNIQEEE